MKEERYYLVMDKLEQGIILRALNDKRTELIEQKKSTDGIDEMILKGDDKMRRLMLTRKSRNSA